MNVAFVCGLLTLFTPSVQADPVDSLIAQQMKAGNIPGLSLLIVQDGKVVKRTAYGVMNTESKVPVKPDTIYETGSIGKSFTATLVMQLVQDGKIKLDAPVKTYLKEAPESWNAITIRHLLSHQSGLQDYVLMPGLGLVDTYTRTQFFDGVTKAPFDFQTGRMFQYSNTNFALLGYVVEAVTGRPFSEVVTERVFKPAGMTDTHFIKRDVTFDRQATGYLLGNGGQLSTGLKTTTSGSGADGMFVSTVDDLVRFSDVLKSGKLLPKSTVALMQRGAPTSTGHNATYGLGWFVRQINGKRFISHGGNSVGYSASISVFPDSGLTIALMCNVYPVGGDNLARMIAEIYDPALVTVGMKEANDPHPKLTAWLLSGLKALAAGEITDKAIDPDFADQLKTGRGQMMRPGFAPFRNLKELRYQKTDVDGPDRIMRYRGIDGDRTFAIVIVVTSDNKIYSAGIRPEA